MNKAIVICYVGQPIVPDAVCAIQQIITSSCDATPELITVKAFNEDSIAKALLKKSAEDSKVTFDNEKKAEDIIAEARNKALDLIRTKYNNAISYIALDRDIAMAKYHQITNSADDDEITLLNAINVIADMPKARLVAALSKNIRDVILKAKDV